MLKMPPDDGITLTDSPDIILEFDGLGNDPAIGKNELRHYKRFHLGWKVAIVYELRGETHTFHGRTHDLSMGGTCVYTDYNFFIGSPVKVLLAPPPHVPGEPPKVIEISARMVYTVLSINNLGFRIGLKFLRFKGNGRKLLQRTLAKHAPAPGWSRGIG